MPNNSSNVQYNEPLDTALNITDILAVCKQFSQLGWKIQSQLEYILEYGIEEAIQSNRIDAQTLPHIRDFLQLICENGYFGDAADQSLELLMMLDDFAAHHPELFTSHQN